MIHLALDAFKQRTKKRRNLHHIISTAALYLVIYEFRLFIARYCMLDATQMLEREEIYLGEKYAIALR